MISGFDLAGDEGYFYLSPTHSGSTTGVVDATAAQTDTVNHTGEGSQVLTVTDDGTPGWFVRHLAGGGSPGNNLSIGADGHVGFWLKTSTLGMSVQIAVDDPGTADRGIAKSVNADGQWRLYEWDLSDDDQWVGWVNGDGVITGPTLTLDSIQITGTGDAVLYIDTVAHNPTGSLLAPGGDYDSDGDVDGVDFLLWQQNPDIGSLSDWEDNYGTPLPLKADMTTVPEPTAFALALIGICLAARRRR